MTVSERRRSACRSSTVRPGTPQKSTALPGMLLLGAVLLVTVVEGRTAAAQQPPPASTVTPSMDAARNLYDRGRFAEARDMLDALIQARNADAEVYYYRGLVEPDAERAAETWFGEVTRRWPGSEWGDRALFQIANYRYAMGYYITARDLFGDVARRRSGTPLGEEALYWRGMTWAYNATAADSLRIGLQLIRQVVRSATSPTVLGKALLSAGELSLQVGQPDSALVYAGQVIEAPYLEDFHPRAMAVQAEAWEEKGDRDQARTLWNLIAARWGDTWEGKQAADWLAQLRETTVQARLDTLKATGASLFAPGGEGRGQWTVQVGAFSDVAAATRMVMALTQKDYQAWHTSKRVEGRLVVAVQVGRFETRAEAVAFGQEMVERGDITEFFPVRNP
jgi:tetratricopeptide (TPR) repeat protein